MHPIGHCDLALSIKTYHHHPAYFRNISLSSFAIVMNWKTQHAQQELIVFRENHIGNLDLTASCPPGIK
jgi:hypothetical protein